MIAPDAVLLDIEGTLSSASYVARVLWTYSRDHMADFVAEHAHDPRVARALAETAALSGEIDDPAAVLVRWIDEDRKAPTLKELQGLLWSEGFSAGLFTGHMYPDALRALRRWHRAGLALWVFSSGSVRTQKEFFAHLPEGDVTGLFRGHFDTSVGAKVEADAYRRIAATIGAAPSRTLFLSDNPRELAAAMDAGLQTIQVVREDTVPHERYAQVTSFAQVQIG